MSTEKKKKFIIDVTYLALILVLSYLLLQYALPLLLPFVLAFLIAYVLRRPIRFLSRVLHAPKGLVAVLLVVLTYGTIGLLLALAGIRITATITSLVQQIPSLYSAYILPELTDFFAWLEELLAKLDPSLMSALQELQSQLLNMLWQLVSSLSVVLVGGVSIATSFATSLPGFLIRLLLMVISTFFIAVDYQKIVRFCLGCLQGSTRNLVLQVKAYVVGTLFVCIRSYALIMFITFVELSIGLSVIRVERAMLVALLIAIFDIRSGHRRYHDPLGHSLRAGRRSSPRLRTAGSVRHHHRHPQHHRAPDRGGTDRPASCADTDEHVCGQPPVWHRGPVRPAHPAVPAAVSQ